MAGEICDRPNPPPGPSHVPASANELSVKLEKLDLSEADLTSLQQFRRASNYIAAGGYISI